MEGVPMTRDHIKHLRGVYASPRQPQGHFGRGKDYAQPGSSDDVNRQLNERGAYRDAESPQDPATVPRPRTPGRPATTGTEGIPPSGTKAKPGEAEPAQREQGRAGQGS